MPLTDPTTERCLLELFGELVVLVLGEGDVTILQRSDRRPVGVGIGLDHLLGLAQHQRTHHGEAQHRQHQREPPPDHLTTAGRRTDGRDVDAVALRTRGCRQIECRHGRNHMGCT